MNLDDGTPEIHMNFGGSGAGKPRSRFGLPSHGGWSSGWGASTKAAHTWRSDGTLKPVDDSCENPWNSAETKKKRSSVFVFDAFKGRAVQAVDPFAGLSKSQKKKLEEQMKLDAKTKKEEDAKREAGEDAAELVRQREAKAELVRLEEEVEKKRIEEEEEAAAAAAAASAAESVKKKKKKAAKAEPTGEEKNEDGDWGAFGSISKSSSKKEKEKEGKKESPTEKRVRERRERKEREEQERSEKEAAEKAEEERLVQEAEEAAAAEQARIEVEEADAASAAEAEAEAVRGADEEEVETTRIAEEEVEAARTCSRPLHLLLEGDHFRSCQRCSAMLKEIFVRFARENRIPLLEEY
ncbi:hypothetical protein HBI56_185600 [Parastagonospora nodorum]|nr:hypothetical protein HBH56_164030 [Parastagonospora nodorum]QRD06533.1 hypothetical protein JI435_119020 [Parastagonospora nodorum SN15]KAH3931982.1 hypothetical protein HBH54_085210 [Parastagonospora nodorum]KAH3947702.1 hypothetical protein HBH53_112500 [Parastagonospora nodorum]KAH3969160.1 hypothetical protein HBH52_177330 [Parastagonospora nodorum]